MKRILYISLLLLLNAIAFPLASQISNTRDYITVRLIPDHSDWNYRTCCPTSTLSVWSVLGTKTKKSPRKELFVVQDCAHWQYPEHRQARHRWVLSAE